jgi:phenazine biosynthesis protein phzE
MNAENANEDTDQRYRAMLDALLSPDPPPFCLLRRPRSIAGPDRLEIIVGDVVEVDRLDDIPLPTEGATEDGLSGGPRHEVLALVPYRQIGERGFACHDDGEPVIAITVRGQGTVSVDEAVRRIGDVALQLDDAAFDIDDPAYADITRRIMGEEIGTGEGANFVIKRSFTGTIRDYSVRKALAIFRHLLLHEAGAYWTFITHTGSRTFVGASPERHVSLTDGIAVMNPISGTYRYPPSGPSLQDVMSFLADRKEADELYMVVDEELKMMARICDSGGQVVGPRLKEMARLAHTEYLIQGHSSLDVRTILKETMFAPTVTGSPLENACRVIRRHEPVGRGYYSGLIALVGRDARGRRELDASILIRTVDINRSGDLNLGVGATLVRHSDPVSEVAETHAKAAGLLAALGVDGHGARTGPAVGKPDGGAGPRLADHPEVRSALTRRNDRLARFWLTDHTSRRREVPRLRGLRAVVVDAEDTFTEMFGHQLRALGLDVVIVPYREAMEATKLDGFDLTVIGPGPGDPCDLTDPKIVTLRTIARRLLRNRSPFLAVCLGHQVLASVLGLEVFCKPSPNQGAQIEIDLFGDRERAGFYNTFAARYPDDLFFHPAVSGPIEVSRDTRGGEVHGLRCARFASLQFHPESLLTERGITILSRLLTDLVGRGPAGTGFGQDRSGDGIRRTAGRIGAPW